MEIRGLEELRRWYLESPQVEGIVVLPSSTPVVVLVVDDTADDEFVSAVAAADTGSAPGLCGAWVIYHHADTGDSGLIFKLYNVSSDEPQLWRRWQFPNPPDDVLEQVADARGHLVSLLPLELARDFADGLDLHSVGGSLIVELLDDPDAGGGAALRLKEARRA